MPVLIFYILNVSQFDFVRPGLKKHNINSLSKLKRLGKMVNIISKFFHQDTPRNIVSASFKKPVCHIKQIIFFKNTQLMSAPFKNFK